MFEFKYVSKFMQKILIRCEFYNLCVSWNFSNFILKLRVFAEEILNLDKLLVANNSNR